MARNCLPRRRISHSLSWRRQSQQTLSDVFLSPQANCYSLPLFLLPSVSSFTSRALQQPRHRRDNTIWPQERARRNFTSNLILEKQQRGGERVGGRGTRRSKKTKQSNLFPTNFAKSGEFAADSEAKQLLDDALKRTSAYQEASNEKQRYDSKLEVQVRKSGAEDNGRRVGRTDGPAVASRVAAAASAVDKKAEEPYLGSNSSISVLVDDLLQTEARRTNDSRESAKKRQKKQFGGNRKDWTPVSESGVQDLLRLVKSLQDELKKRNTAENTPQNETKAPSPTYRGTRRPSNYRRLSVSKIQSDSLPDSPLPKWIEYKWEKKATPNDEERQRLMNNLWANMLASPIRYCSATSVRMPRDLMVELGLVRNPADGEVYLMPRPLADMSSLSRNFVQKYSNVVKVDTDGTQNGQADEYGGETETGSQMANRALPKINLLPSSSLFHHLTDMMNRSKQVPASEEQDPQDPQDSAYRFTKARPVSRLLPMRWKLEKAQSQRISAQKGHASQASIRNDAAQSMTDPRSVAWSSEIHDIILEILRQRVSISFKEVLGSELAKLRKRARLSHAGSAVGRLEDSMQTTEISSVSLLLLVNDAPAPEKQGAVGAENRGVTEANGDDNIAPQHSKKSGRGSITLESITFSPTPKEHATSQFFPGGLSQSTPVSPPTTTFRGVGISYLHDPPLTNSSSLDSSSPGMVSKSALIPRFYDLPSTNNHLSRRVPLFSLSEMLGPSQSARLEDFEKVFRASAQKAQELEGNSRPGADGGKQVRGNLILLDVEAPVAQRFAEELWRLWRFLDGDVGA